MHEVQKKLLNIVENVNLKRDGLRQIARLIGEAHPFNVSYHLKKLEEKGFVKINKETGVIRKLKDEIDKSLFLAIPVLGSANCGEANIFAEEDLEGYIKVSKNIVRPQKNLFAIRASGNSMNKANIKGQSVVDGDYVIVDPNKQPEQNSYVLANIDGCANVKKFFLNKKDNIISLTSESTENHPVIFIHEDDKFLINGVVEYVIKN